MSLLQQFKYHFEAQFALFSGKPLLLAISGGMDSMVMGHLFHAIQHPFAVAHCNFGLRGDESDTDADFVGAAAQHWNAPFFVKHFNTKAYAIEKGISTQMAARELRYEWFCGLCTRHQYAALVTAHHLNDQAETILLNLGRGKGLYGQKGMEAQSQYVSEPEHVAMPILRPLLVYKNKDLAEYALSNGIKWREDSSNKQDKYARNQIRHKVVPVLESINPAFLSVLEKHTQRVAGVLDNHRFLLSQYLGNNKQIDKERLKSLPNVEQALFSRLHTFGFNEELVRQIADNLDNVGLVIHGEQQWQAIVERGHISLSIPPEATDFIMSISEDDLMVSLPGAKRLFLMPSAIAPPYPDGTTAVVVDRDLIVFPLSVRIWQPGDYFQPLGMKGQHQKLQDFLTNKKISHQDKNQVMLLLNGDDTVIWVMGHRLDERYKVSEKTNNAMIIRIL